MPNQTIDLMMNRKSIRKYKPDVPTDEIIHTIVKAGLQAPFASQLCSLIITREADKHPFNAPIAFYFLLDFHRMELIMKKRGWENVSCNLWIYHLGMQDVTLAGENMVIAAESLGLGSCYIGMTPFAAKQIAKRHKLPKRVFPVVQLAMGYPDEDKPPRPRYPLEFSLFENEYPEFTDEQINEAMKVMDDGYLAQDYYRNPDIMIPLQGEREEIFDYDNYSWTEHISRKWGQWIPSPDKLLKQFKECEFDLTE